MTRLLYPALIALLLSGCGGSSQESAGSGDGIPEGPLVEARLVADAQGLRPGETRDVGVVFDISEGWHLYWKGQNSSGLPPTAAVTLPDGFEAGDLRWPAPRRKVSPGGILDHVYEGRVTLLLPVTAPAGAKPGTPFDIEVALDWLVCREACIAESDTVRLAWTVANAEPQPRRLDEDARSIAHTRERLPRAAENRVNAGWNGATLTLSASGGREIAFYPAEESPATVDLIADGSAEGDKLNIRFVPETLDRPVTGVIEVQYPDRSPGIFRVHVPAPSRDDRG